MSILDGLDFQALADRLIAGRIAESAIGYFSWPYKLDAVFHNDAPADPAELRALIDRKLSHEVREVNLVYCLKCAKAAAAMDGFDERWAEYIELRTRARQEFTTPIARSAALGLFYSTQTQENHGEGSN